ncbi:hypothetical protein [Bartonella sp. AC331YNZD]|uniref:hypothetical protein n=1 Tax=Bartonella sp. AC331YNZD TaxID=3243454 RepID=UPI0035CEE511
MRSTHQAKGSFCALKESIIDFACSTGIVFCKFLAEIILNVSEANVELIEDTPFGKSTIFILGHNFGKKHTFEQKLFSNDKSIFDLFNICFSYHCSSFLINLLYGGCKKSV